MNHEILAELQSIEKEYSVEILYAVQAGSRAWGFSSPESDHDIRFIYRHSLEWYLSLEENRDVIEKQPSSRMELSGWDLKKALKLFRKSNPSILEWLHTEEKLIADPSFCEKILPLQSKAFSPSSCYYHYLSMSKSNYHKWHNQGFQSVKLTLHLLRGILACRWIRRNEAFPPVRFEDLLSHTVSDSAVKEAITSILELKKSGAAEWEGNQEHLLSFIEKEMMNLIDRKPSFQEEGMAIKKDLDELFRSLILK
ncbi:nucleotidyltransferase domain-containing protein [Bacillus sp. AK031]